MRDPKNTAGLTAYEADFLQGIDQSYWAVTQVGSPTNEVVPANEDEMRFVYTTGLYYRFRHPELLIYGLPFDSMLEVLRTLGNQVKAGKTYGVGIPYKDIFEGRPCRFQHVERLYYRDRLAASNWFYESDKYPTLQVFWSDSTGLFPWDRGCNPVVRDAQPMLFQTLATGRA